MQDSEEMETDDITLLQMIPAQIRHDAYKLIPDSYWAKCTCCVIYDEHPRDNKKIDITICLQGGKVRELYKNEPVSSIEVPEVDVFKNIRILRDNEGTLFYLAKADDNLVIISSKDKLSIHCSFSNVTFYEICDPQCSGEPKLMIRTQESTHYLSITHQLEETKLNTKRRQERKMSVITDLNKKLIEAKNNLQCNVKGYEEIKALRQHANFLCRDDVQLQAPKSIIRFCNRKIVILLEIENPYNESMENVSVLIHNSSCISISYTSKVYQRLTSSPLYREIEHREIKRRSKSSIAVVIPIKEFKNSVSSKIEFNVILTYETQGKDYLKSFENVFISPTDVMNKNFDVFNSPEVDECSMILAMLSTTTKTTLCCKQMEMEGNVMDPSTFFCKYLKMDLLKKFKNVAIHKHSPLQILHGMMIIFSNDSNCFGQHEFNIKLDVFSRSASQVQALVHLIYDRVPRTLIVTTPNMRLSSHEGFENNTSDLLNFDCTPCAESLLKQCSMTLEYLCDCKQEMQKTSVKNMESFEEINLLAMGQEAFVNYRNKMLAEAELTFEHIQKCSQSSYAEHVMEIDDT